MKTVVFQSYRTSRVAPWIVRCMESVRAWAAANDFEYRFIDDRFLDYAPAWYREKAAHNLLLVTDLARLVAARELLAAGYERTVWMDADLLVFDPRPASFQLADGYAFCREVWAWRQSDGAPLLPPDRANNSVSVFDRGNPVLEFLIYAAQALMRNAAGRPHPTAVSTQLLSALNERMGLPLLRHFGMLSPFVMRALLEGDEGYLRTYMARVGEPMVAANLCGSFTDAANHGTTLPESVYDETVRVLLETRGAALNRFLPSTVRA
ncbi:MAG: hypothetical protein ACM30H_06500 [Clostridia bacterium]